MLRKKVNSIYPYIYSLDRTHLMKTVRTLTCVNIRVIEHSQQQAEQKGRLSSFMYETTISFALQKKQKSREEQLVNAICCVNQNPTGFD